MRFGMFDTTNLPPCRQKEFGHTVYYPQFDPKNYRTSYTERMAQLLLPLIDNIESCHKDIQIAMKHNGKTYQEAKILIAEFTLSNLFFSHFGF